MAEPPVEETWCLQRQNHPETTHQLTALIRNKEKLIVGRVAGRLVDIVCNGETVSRKHCELVFAGNTWRIRDLESLNGIYLNKEKVVPNTFKELRHGDVLGVGAVDCSQASYFVFDVIKKVIKAEKKQEQCRQEVAPSSVDENVPPSLPTIKSDVAKPSSGVGRVCHGVAPASGVSAPGAHAEPVAGTTANESPASSARSSTSGAVSSDLCDPQAPLLRQANRAVGLDETRPIPAKMTPAREIERPVASASSHQVQLATERAAPSRCTIETNPARLQLSEKTVSSSTSVLQSNPTASVGTIGTMPQTVTSTSAELAATHPVPPTRRACATSDAAAPSSKVSPGPPASKPPSIIPRKHQNPVVILNRLGRMSERKRYRVHQKANGEYSIEALRPKIKQTPNVKMANHRRVSRLIDSDEEPQPSTSSEMTWIPADQFRSSMGPTSDSALPAPSRSTNERGPSESVAERIDCNRRPTVLQNDSVSAGNQTAKTATEVTSPYSQSKDFEDDDDDEPIFVLCTTSTISSGTGAFGSDDDCIVLNSDDETYSSQRPCLEPVAVKSEPVDLTAEDEIGGVSPYAVSDSDEDAHGPPVAALRSSMPGVGTTEEVDDDGPFFPILSQRTLEEFRAEELAEAANESEAGAVPSDHDRLQQLVESDRFKLNEKTTLLTEARPLHKRKPADADPKRRTGDSRSDPKKTIVMIPPEPAPARRRRRLRPKSSMRADFQKQQGLEGYPSAVKQYHKKPTSGSGHVSTSVTPQASTSGVAAPRKDAAREGVTSVAAHKEKTACPNSAIVAKVTKRSRSDKLLGDVVPNDKRKRGPPDAISNFKIPKVAKNGSFADAGSSATAAAAAASSEAAQIHSTEGGEEQAAGARTETVENFGRTPTFKPIVQRIAHQANYSDQVAPHASTSCSSTSTYRPRAEAVPLGRAKPVPVRPVQAGASSSRQDGQENWRLAPAPAPSNAADSAGLATDSDANAPVPPLARRSGLGTDDRPFRSGSPPTTAVPSNPEARSKTPQGILNVTGHAQKEAECGARRKVIFNDTLQIREIEAREPRAPSDTGAPLPAAERSGPRDPRARKSFSSRPSSSIQPQVAPVSQSLAQHPASTEHNAAKELVNNMLLRIAWWNFNWIGSDLLRFRKEQLEVKADGEPPPILQGITGPDRPQLPALDSLPVVSSFHDLSAYLGIFNSLMLHELWANICKEYETLESRQMVATFKRPSKIHPSEHWWVVEATTLVGKGEVCLREHDLVVLTIPNVNKPEEMTRLFAIVGTTRFRACQEPYKQLDHRLVSHYRRRHGSRLPDEIHYANLKMRNTKTKENINFLLSTTNPPLFTLAKLCSLNTVIKQFRINAELYRSPLRHVILRPGANKDAFKLADVSIPESGHPKLNLNQYRAVKSISTTMLESQGVPKVALLHGPPGTGKTHVIVQMVTRMLYKFHSKRKAFPTILVCAPSNYAVDEITFRLMKTRDSQPPENQFQVVRIGVPGSIAPKVAKVTLDVLADERHSRNVRDRDSVHLSNIRSMSMSLKNLGERKQEIKDKIREANMVGNDDEAKLMGRKINETEGNIENLKATMQALIAKHNDCFERGDSRLEVLSSAHVICSTLNSCRSRDMEKVFINGQGRFLCCVIDEASQCTEPESLTPLGLGICKLVLIGDPEQLPATVSSQFAARHGFDQSLFNRFFSRRTSDGSHSVLMLDTQYRMNQEICSWPSKFFYGRKLLTAKECSRNGPCFPYLFLDVEDGNESMSVEDGKSINNRKEAEVVAKMVKILLDNPSLNRKSIGVITFYQSQRQCIKEEIHSRCAAIGSRVEVQTVDAYQGQEKDVVILSCVRAKNNPGAEIGFVSSLQRMNVALTRAKESLFVCGNARTLEVNDAWKDLIADARQRGLARTVSSRSSSSEIHGLLLRCTPMDI